MATIGSLAVNIVATTDKFIAGLNNANKSLKGFVGKVSGAGSCKWQACVSGANA